MASLSFVLEFELLKRPLRLICYATNPLIGRVKIYECRGETLEQILFMVGQVLPDLSIPYTSKFRKRGQKS